MLPITLHSYVFFSTFSTNYGNDMVKVCHNEAALLILIIKCVVVFERGERRPQNKIAAELCKLRDYLERIVLTLSPYR